MTDLSLDVQDALGGIADALADSVSPLAAKVEQARWIAADLEAELAACRQHLAAVLPLVSTTWAQDTRAVDAAQAYLDREPYE